MCEVYKNKEVIQTSLTKASGFTIGEREYWSSSQSDYYGEYGRAYYVPFSNGGVYTDYKKWSHNVCVLKALTAK